MKRHPSERLKELLGRPDRDVAIDRVWKAIEAERMSAAKLTRRSPSPFVARPWSVAAALTVFLFATTALGMRAWPAIRRVFGVEAASSATQAEPRERGSRRRVPTEDALTRDEASVSAPTPAPAPPPQVEPASPPSTSVPATPSVLAPRGGLGTTQHGFPAPPHVSAVDVEVGAPSVDAAALLARADLARVERRPHDAVDALERLLAEHASSAEAPLAALDLARVELEHLNRPERALQAVRRALALGVPRQLDARARFLLVEALRRGGHDTEARAAATDLLARHPEGPYAAELRGRFFAE